MTSPFIPDVRVEAGLSGPVIDPAVWQIGDAVRGKIGTAAIGADDIWVDISYAVVSWNFRRGSARGDGVGLRYEAGTAAIELNNGNRDFDPTNLAGPFVSGGVSTLRPMTRVRITAVWDGFGYRQYTGLADSWTPDFTSPTWSTTTLLVTDGFKVFTSIDRAATTPVGSGDLSGDRIERILTAMGWPTDDRDIAAGDSQLQATTLAGNVLTEMQLTQDSERGELYMNPFGAVTFRNRRAILFDVRSTVSQVVFGDAGVDAGEVPYATAQVSNDDTTMANEVTVTRAGGTAQVASDATSISQFLTKSYSPGSELLVQTDAEALSVAKWILAQSKDPELRFTAVTLNIPRAGTGDTVWPLILDRDLGDRVTVIRRPPGGGDPIQLDAFIRSIEHSSENAADYKVTFGLQSAGKYAFWTIGDPSLGRIGFNALAF